MDIAQLKLHATRMRALLEQANHPVGHNQSLDLIAALVGLRNWPEVQAFPERVAACELDLTSTGRLAFRLNKRFGLDVSAQTLLAKLAPLDLPKRDVAPHVWPAGPRPGVYITTSQDAIDALLDRYEEATDGALLYAERAGNQKDSAIDLGENGLWSSGLARVPSGTLLVVGPLRLDQQSWEDSTSRLHMACLSALDSGHRVAVLLETPTPDRLAEDVLLMVRRAESSEDAPGELTPALIGVVTDNGELLPREPFARSRHQPMFVPTVATLDALPVIARVPLQQAVARHQSGLLLFGSGAIREHWAIDLVNAGLALTEHAGPAARIMPRHRSTPAKDWDVPDGLKQLPFLPSVESAYDQGFRRMVINPHYTDGDLLMEYGKDVLFIAGAHASDVEGAFLSGIRGRSRAAEVETLKMVIALMAVTRISTATGEVAVTDLYIHDEAPEPSPELRFDALMDFLKAHRTMQIEDQLTALLRTRALSIADLKEVSRNQAIQEFVSKVGGSESGK